MLNYCNNVLLIACLYNNIMQIILQMVTVALYVFMAVPQAFVFRRCAACL